MPAFRAGVLLEILVQAGESVPIGTPIAVIGEQGEKYDPAALGVTAKAEARPLPPQAAPAEPARQQEKSSARLRPPLRPRPTPAPAPAPAEPQSRGTAA